MNPDSILAKRGLFLYSKRLLKTRASYINSPEQVKPSLNPDIKFKTDASKQVSRNTLKVKVLNIQSASRDYLPMCS